MRKLARSVLLRTPRLYALLTSQWRYRALYRLGLVHERDFRALLLLVQRPDPLILDVGANNGQSILSIKRVLPQARIISFEPARRHEGDLQALARRFPYVTIELCALGDVDNEAELYWPVYNGVPMHALASLDYNEASEWLRPERVYAFDRHRLKIESEQIRIRRLDNFGLEPDLIKIDVQGTEDAVIRGGLETIRRTRAPIIAESLDEASAAYNLLEPLSYDVYSFYKNSLNRETGGVNRILVSRERSRLHAHQLL